MFGKFIYVLLVFNFMFFLYFGGNIFIIYLIWIILKKIVIWKNFNKSIESFIIRIFLKFFYIILV